MNIDNLDIVAELITKKENEQVEFKETTGQLERGMETLCAFLNREGGTVLFGVTDKGKIIGQEVSDKTKRDIAEAIRRIEPFASVEISYIIFRMPTRVLSLSSWRHSNICDLSLIKDAPTNGLRASHPPCHRIFTISF